MEIKQLDKDTYILIKNYYDFEIIKANSMNDAIYYSKKKYETTVICDNRHIKEIRTEKLKKLNLK